MKPLNVTVDFQFVGENKMVTSDCLAITFKRPTGSNAVSVNGYPLAEGEALEIAQSQNNIDRTQYNIKFSGAGSDQLWVFRTLVLSDYFRD